jgi:hypothetical protein
MLMKLSPDEEDGMCELLGLTGQKFQMEFGPKKKKRKKKILEAILYKKIFS